MDETPLARLRDLRVPEGAVGLCWLGQSGFALRAGGATALLDPFLAPYPGRRYESGLPPARAEGIDDVFRDAGFEWRDAGCSDPPHPRR